MTGSQNAEVSTHDTESGFSLVELLVGLALLSLILVILLSSIRLTSQLLLRTEAIAHGDSFREVERYLRRLVSQIHRRPIGGSGPQSIDRLRGSRGEMEFLTSYAAQGQFSGLYLAKLVGIGQRPGDMRLEVRLEPLARLSKTRGRLATQSGSYTLIDKLDNVWFQYFGSLDQPENASWQSEWRREELPRLIKIHLSKKVGGILRRADYLVDLDAR